MNLVEKFGLVIAGPYPGFVVYAGDFLWFIALGYEKFNSFPLYFFLLLAFHMAINLVQIHRLTLIKNGTFGELNPETTALIQQKAVRDNIPNIIIKLVTNLPVLNALCGRKITCCEIFISHHWFAIPEGIHHLDTILEHEFAHARAHHTLKRTLFATALFGVGIGAFLYLMSLDLFPQEQMYACNALVVFCIFRVTTFLQAWYHRHQEFEADAMALSHTTAAKLATSLTFMREHNHLEKIQENIPEWARATHPYIASRVHKLLN